MSTQSPQRLAKADRLQSSIYGPRVSLDRPPYITPRRPETEPIERFSDEQFGFLIDKLLEDWDSPTLSELGLCRAHSITLEELDAITDDADFQRALALVRRVRDKRQHEREASARAALFDRLLRLVNQTSDNNTATKEVRLACKQLETLMQRNPGHAHDESSNRGVLGGADLQSASSVTPPPPHMQSADSSSPSPTSSPAGGVAGEVPEQREGGGANPQPETQDPSLTLRAPPQPTPNPHKPQSPRGYKPRPKPKSR